MFLINKPVLASFYLIRQSIFAGLVLMLMLLFFNKVSSHPIFNAIGLTSVASSIFIIFSAQHTIAGQNKSIIGGYVIGILVGIGCHYLLHYTLPFYFQLPGFVQSNFILLCGGLTITSVLLLMTILQMPHPPAAGLALGIVIDAWEPQALIIIALIIVTLTLLKHFLKFKPLIIQQ